MSWYIEIKVKLCLIDLITIVETILPATTQDQPHRVKIAIRSTLPCDSLDCIKKKPILALAFTELEEILDFYYECLHATVNACF